ncbi:FAD dependent oxidoreductase [Lepidopterella palustris CBS 459.81]|uniref:FAD dependent oxidoreductase n=1 Tax=Lepidopterella palustris CBS 459.81 TaxID=1314670 RepID=A0A8E2JEY3_9PEZI|nr:FAD dependent oxidoreductase [Lepidopterella palustris CBS 459.81]
MASNEQTSSPKTPPGSIPASILIIGSGVFGLSTAYSLCKNPAFRDTSITLVDRQPFPARDAASIDTSRIIRPDYADPAYAALACAAQTLWRGEWGASGRYHESGLCLTVSPGRESYVSASLANIQKLTPSSPTSIELLHSPADIVRAAGVERASGSTGYLNKTSGWADAEAAMRWLHSEVSALNRVNFVTATVSRLLINHDTSTVCGAKLVGTENTLTATLTILAAGAWTPSLLDLRGIATATGQPLAYLPLTPSEQTALSANPTLLNMSTGLFVIPPSNSILKIAHHSYGYSNPVTIPHPEFPDSKPPIVVSLPKTTLLDPTQHHPIPPASLSTLTDFLLQIHPSLSALSSPNPTPNPFTHTRLCWYTDTRTGDFLISYHPTYNNLFVATGGSGHAFKFLPVIGDKIVECIMGRPPMEFREKWAWPRETMSEGLWEGDGSRGGSRGMVLEVEMGMRVGVGVGGNR